MKKITVCGFGVVGVLLLAATSNAANPGPAAPVAPAQHVLTPGALLLNPLKLVSVTRATPDANGVFQIDVGVENIGGTPIRMGVEAHAAGAAANGLLQAMDVPSKTTKHFIFADPTGGPQICTLVSNKEYAISISDMSARAPDAHRAVLHATACSVSATIDSPWNHQTPDSVEYTQKNALYTENVVIEQQPTCDKALKLKGGIYNHTATAQNGVKVVAKQGTTTLASSASFNVAKGGYAPMTLSYSNFSTVPAHISLEGGTGVVNAGITVKVNASCTYSADLDPKADAAPAVPK